MAIMIPADTGDTWVRHEIPRGVCFAVSIPPGISSKLFLVLPDAGDSCIEVTVGDGATCEILTVQERAMGTVRAEARIGNNGALHWRPLTIGGTVEHRIRSVCTGEHARSEASWILLAREGEHPKAIMRNMFEAREGRGDVAMRAVAFAQGHILLDGRIEIDVGGGGTQTYLTQEALMLDASARIDAIPGLEIKTNDVKASHSATVSRVHPDDVFYAGSRGMKPDEAQRMLVEGFLGSVLDGMDDDALRMDLMARVTAGLSPA